MDFRKYREIGDVDPYRTVEIDHEKGTIREARSSSPWADAKQDLAERLAARKRRDRAEAALEIERARRARIEATLEAVDRLLAELRRR